jgi:hypothetical protein
MATTTTNFGWDIPQSTDLVKDGATAIAALGQDIDTAFVDFKGGTTGQVLKKTSGTDLDVEWGTPSSGLTLINTTSFSAVASQSVNDVFSATYDNYLILFNNLTASSDGWMNMRMRVAGADDTTSNYRFQEISGSSTTVAGARQTGLTSWVNFNYAQSLAQSPSTFNLFNPFKTFVTSLSSIQAPVSNGNIEVFAKSFGLNTTTSYTGFSFFPSSVGPTLTGSVSVYGYNK